MDNSKKRGRPKKIEQPKNVVNEEKKMVTMTTENAEQSNFVPPNQDKVSLEAIQQRWANIFGKYASTRFDNMAGAWGMAWSQLNNPFVQNYRLKQANAKAQKVQSEDLQKALSDPENSEMVFQRISMWLYYTNYVYNILVKLNRDTPLFKYYYLPEGVEESDMKTEAFKKESQKVNKILKAFNPNLTWKTITTQVTLEGKSSYLPRVSYDNKDVDFFVMQKLNSDMVKLTGFGSKQQFITSFNMAIFLQPAYDVSQYPKFIQDVWQQMLDTGVVIVDKKNKKRLSPKAKLPAGHILESNGQNYMYWVQLPQDLCYTFYFDGAHPNAFPDAIGLFDDLTGLDDYKWLQANLLSKGVNSILTAEVPIIRDPKARSDATVITPDTILGYQDYFAENISANILPFFGPFEEFELHTLENQPEAMDIIYDRTRDLIATSGNSALMSITDKPSIASVKAQQYIQASRVDYLTRQYENFMNEMINKNFGLKYNWRVSFWGDIFNIREDIKVLREQVVSGLEGFIPKLLSANDMTVDDYKQATMYLKAMDIKVEKVADAENLIANPVGRPKLNDDEITNDNTGISSNTRNNVSDIKEFTYIKKCRICDRELNEDEDLICNECLEEMYENRIDDSINKTQTIPQRKVKE